MIKQLIYFQDSETNEEGIFFFCVSVLGPYHCPKNFSICGFEISRIGIPKAIPYRGQKFKTKTRFWSKTYFKNRPILTVRQKYTSILGRKMIPYLRTIHVDHEGDVEAESMVRLIRSRQRSTE